MKRIIAVLLLSCCAALGNAANIEAGKAKAESCMACHGAAGVSADKRIPSLAGQPSLFIVYQLIQFRGSQRVFAPMNAVASSLTDDDMRNLAAYYNALPPAPAASGSSSDKVQRGQTVSDANHCQSCHTPDLRGQKQVPRLAGQHAEYLAAQLKGLRDGTRADIDGSMASAAQGLSNDDIDALATWAAAMPTTAVAK